MSMLCAILYTLTTSHWYHQYVSTVFEQGQQHLVRGRKLRLPQRGKSTDAAMRGNVGDCVTGFFLEPILCNTLRCR